MHLKRYVVDVHLIFDVRKAIAAAGFVCQQNDGRCDLLKLIKILYLADRTALTRWHRPITGDDLWSLEHGPIVSKVYDLIRGRAMGPEMVAWAQAFNPRDGDIVSVKGEISSKPLSRREKAVLLEAFNKIHPLSIGQVIDFMHSLPEWRNPGKSAEKIDARSIFFHENLGIEQVNEIEDDLLTAQLAKAALQSVGN